jgi:hypothetical protein
MNRTPSISFRTYRRDIYVLALFVIAMGIPFISQPFHVDDNFYIDMARNALHKPFYPNDTPYIFEGTASADMGSHSHPPFQAYFLAAILWMFGEGAGKEWIYHSISLIFPLLAVISFYSLSRRFLSRPLWGTLLFACCPVLLVMEHNLMTDVPNLSFWLASVATFLHASEKDSIRAYAASSLFQFLAMFTSYTSLALTPLLGFYHYRSSRKARGWIFLSVPFILMIIWFASSCIHYGRFLLIQTVSFVHAGEAWSIWKLAVKFGAILQYQGWLTIFPAFLLAVFVCSLHRFLLLPAAMASIAATYFASPRYLLLDRIVYALGVLIGLALLYRFAAMLLCRRTRSLPGSGWTDTQRQFLCCWYFGVIAFCMLVYVDGSARYILPLLPPVVLCFCGIIEAGGFASCIRFLSHRRKPVLLYTAILFSAVWGLALSHADFEFASIYPRAAHDFAPIACREESYYGGEWGFRYYFGRAGFRQMPPNDQPLPVGSLLVRPAVALPYELGREALAGSRRMQLRKYKVKNPLRLLDVYGTAGFYSTYWGKLPFSFSSESLETIEVRRFLPDPDTSN